MKKLIDKLFNKDSIIQGILVGLILPLIGYGILTGVNHLVHTFPSILNTKAGFMFSLKLIMIISICFNGIAGQYFLNRKLDQSIRGLVFPTFALLAVWAYMFLPDVLDALGF